MLPCERRPSEQNSGGNPRGHQLKVWRNSLKATATERPKQGSRGGADTHFPTSVNFRTHQSLWRCPQETSTLTTKKTWNSF
jgi:hypothetical protein